MILITDRITTYNEMMRLIPSKKATRTLYDQRYSPEEKKTHSREQKGRILEKLQMENGGPLFQMKFWRVILDEAHTIKDPSSQSQ